MSIKIHHGPPGSYKTSGAVQDDIIRWAMAGRTIVTNVRGLSKERILENIECGEGFDLVNVNTDTTEEKVHFARWFHWVPIGCALLIDEVQRIYPPASTRSELEKHANTKDADRPPDVWFAFEAHRHYNWDLVLTTPNIKRVASFIRECSEAAYYHVNKARIGIPGRYVEAMHDPSTNGNTESSQIDVVVKKIKPATFQLYESTATGEVKDTEAGRSIFKNPKVIAFALFLGIMLFWSGSRLVKMVYADGDDESESIQPDSEVVAEADLQDNLGDSVAVRASLPVIPPDPIVVNKPIKEKEKSFIDGMQIYIALSMSSTDKSYVLNIDGTQVNIHRDDLRRRGVILESVADCLDREISTGRFITCPPAQEEVGGNQPMDLNIFSYGNDEEVQE